MNVFFRIGDALVTPETDGNILHGITRDSIIRIAEKEGIKLEVRPVTVEEVAAALRTGTMLEAFGAGTAATIAHIKSIAFEDEEFQLPVLENRTYSNLLGQRLDDIRRGRVEDSFGWLVPVN